MDIESDPVAANFIGFSRHKLLEEYWPRTCKCLDSLAEEQIWWRPHESSNSIGNLLLHLNGNLRQWMVGAVGGVKNERDRDAEFAERQKVPAGVLRARLEETLREIDGIFGRLTPADLLKKHTIQGYNVTGVEAIYHAIEHFGMHHGQILYITKMLKETDLGFYRHLGGRAAETATGTK
jgi:uncharacterized damage-inducible protein DinB